VNSRLYAAKGAMFAFYVHSIEIKSFYFQILMTGVIKYKHMHRFQMFITIQLRSRITNN
jgi:hypothetical protein